MRFFYEYILIFIIALIAAFSITPIVKRFAFKWGAVSVPKDDRRMHTKPMPLLGGLAMIFGFGFSILFTVIALRINLLGESGIFRTIWQFLAFAGGILVIAAMGVIDDIKVLSAKVKLPVHLTIAFLIAWSGTRITDVTNPFAASGMSALPDVVSYIVTILWIVGITNAFNFIDGLDGLATGVSSISAVSLFVVSLILGRWEIAVMTAALAGATLGFLPFNFNPAKIFMGESGSTFLGFTLAIISIPGNVKSVALIAIAVPLLVFGVPLFDILYAIIRRIANKRSPMQADREHLHHKLIDLGLSQRQSVVIMYILSALLGMCAVLLADKGALSAIILVIAVAVFIFAGSKFMWEIIHENGKDKETDEIKDPDKEKK